MIVRVHAAEAHELLIGQRKLVAVRPHHLDEELRLEAVVAGNHRRMRGEDALLAHTVHGVLKRDAGELELTDELQRKKRTVAFILVIDIILDAQRTQQAHPANPQNYLLPDPYRAPALIKPPC